MSVREPDIFHDESGRSTPSRRRRGPRPLERQRLPVIYFIQAVTGDGLVKIGYSAMGVMTRARTVQNSSPVPLRVLGWTLGTLEEEAHLHQRFSSAHAYGEWFTPEPELLALAASYDNGFDIPLPGIKRYRSEEDKAADEKYLEVQRQQHATQQAKRDGIAPSWGDKRRGFSG